MIAAAPAPPASRASARASTSRTRVQPSTATRPSQASTPTMIRSANRSHTSPRNAGSSAARVPTMAQRAPASSTASPCASSRSPPPTWTGIVSARMISWTMAVWAGLPSNAPSRSTTCRREAPTACHLPAMATGSSANTVSASARPWSRRTQRPRLTSTAGTISNPMASSNAALPPSISHVGGEVLEQPPAPPLALLGRELRREQCSPLHGRREGHPVRARGRAQRRVRGLRVVRVHEVEVGARRDPVEETQVAPMFHLVPPHVRNLEPGREAAHRARDHVEALALSELLALGEEELVAETDPEEGAPVVQAAPDGLQQPEGLEGRHGVVERAIAGQHHRLRVADRQRVLGDDGAHAETIEGLLHAAQIAPAVVDDGDHTNDPGYSVPFVDGTSATRGLNRVASARARPTALNTASAIWCRFSP